MKNIDKYPPRSGKIIRSDDSIVNEADGMLEDGTRKVQLTGSKAIQALVLTVGTDLTPTEGVTVNTDTDAQVIFAVDTIAVTVKLIAGVVYPYSIKKVVAGDGIVGLY